MSSQEPQLLDHSYDGIQEYDNPLPGWWKALFWICFVFAVGYWIYYHVMGTGQMKLDEYAAEMAEAEAKWPKFVLPPKTEDELKTMVADQALVAKGAVKFKEVCAACHGPDGASKKEGGIGPNLTDKTWLHGGKLVNIYTSVGNGWTEKGMPAWGKTLKPEELQAVVAFVASIRNTNLPGKDPQGTAEEDAAAPAPVAAQPAAAPAAPAAEAATPAAAPVPVAPTEAAAPAAAPAAPL